MSLRTSIPSTSVSVSKSRKVKLAVSGLALAAAAAGTIGLWPSSAAAQSAASGTHPAALSASGALAQPATVKPPEAADHAAVLDSLTVSLAAKAVTAKKPVHRKHLTARQIARRMLRSFHWTGWQFQWLNRLWSHESSWNVYASNPYSGAYGIPQAVPGSKMSSAGPNWESSARTQIRWGMDYIKGRYGSPHLAWEHELATGWY